MPDSLDFFNFVKKIRTKPNAGREKLFVELGTNACGGKAAEYFAFGGKTTLFKDEDVLNGDDLAFHAGNFSNRGDAAGAVAQTGGLDKKIDGA